MHTDSEKLTDFDKNLAKDNLANRNTIILETVADHPTD